MFSGKADALKGVVKSGHVYEMIRTFTPDFIVTWSIVEQRNGRTFAVVTHYKLRGALLDGCISVYALGNKNLCFAMKRVANVVALQVTMHCYSQSVRVMKYE